MRRSISVGDCASLPDPKREESHGTPDHASVPRRPRRQPAAPVSLHRAREDAAAGRIDADALRAVEDDAIREAVLLQREVGLQAVTDGEFRRATWHLDFIYALDGISTADDKVKISFHSERGDIEFMAAALHVDGRVGVSETIFGDAFSFLHACADGAVPKLTIQSPSMVHYRAAARRSTRRSIPSSMRSGTT